jgi:hypothetical protein
MDPSGESNFFESPLCRNPMGIPMPDFSFRLHAILSELDHGAILSEVLFFRVERWPGGAENAIE